MKQTGYLILSLISILAVGFCSCSDDSPEQKRGITNPSWKEGQPLEISASQVLPVTFDAAARWTAYTHSAWCTVRTPSGEKGMSTIELSATVASAERTATIIVNMEGYEPQSFEVKQEADEHNISGEVEINQKVDDYLREKYLWNEEYKTLKPDFAKDYKDFFYDALGSMTTNTLDKRPYTDEDGNTGYGLFSYIEKRNPVSETRSVRLVKKELTYSFGITGITPVIIGTESNHTFYFCIQGTYPDSPAARAGIERGAMISRINGDRINYNNLEDYFYKLLRPNSVFNLTLTEDFIRGGKVADTQTFTLTSEAMYCNPVINSKVEERNGHRIGYLVYSEFNAGFDQELFDVFKQFKSRNVTDLILDLRYNGGGHTLSANLIASCIAGEACKGKVFTSLRFNEERMRKRGNKREEEEFAYSHYENLGTSLQAGGLGLKRVYCLTGSGTASSSELVINALRGIDVEVVLIGRRTRGKNVGMEYKDFEVKKDVYRVVPITFQSYNAKGYGDYQDGFAPTLAINETNPNNLERTFYALKGYGTDEEPLYAKAIEQITGRNPMPTTRGIGQPAEVQVRSMPTVHRPGYDGMLREDKE